jgi:hypothetical protein
MHISSNSTTPEVQDTAVLQQNKDADKAQLDQHCRMRRPFKASHLCRCWWASCLIVGLMHPTDQLGQQLVEGDACRAPTASIEAAA